MENEKNTLLPLVENLMEKQRKQNDKLKAEQFIELQTNKDEILEQVKAVADNVSGLQKNIDVMETKMLKNNLQKTGSIHGSIGDELHKNEFIEKLKTWDQRKGRYEEKASAQKDTDQDDIYNYLRENKFLVFGNDRRVPEEWLKRYGKLVKDVNFFFYDIPKIPKCCL